MAYIRGFEGRIVEPLVFPSLLNLAENFRSRLAAQPSRGQELVILYLFRALRYPVPFSAIFTFHGTPPRVTTKVVEVELELGSTRVPLRTHSRPPSLAPGQLGRY